MVQETIRVLLAG